MTSMEKIVLVAYDPVRHLEPCLDIWFRASLEGHPFLGEAALLEDREIVTRDYMPNAEITVAEASGEPAGFIAMLADQIGGLFVDPEMHRMGIGRTLIDAAAISRSNLIVEVYEFNLTGRRFYEALGFVGKEVRPCDDRGRPFALRRMVRRSGP